MRGQAYLDLAGAFLVLMLVAATGFAAAEKIGGRNAQDAAECSLKNSVHSYADWLVKEGGSMMRENADGSGFYLHHEMDLEKIWGAGRGFGISVFYPDGKVVVLKEGEGGAGSKYCVKRIALCEGRVCALRVCKNDDV